MLIHDHKQIVALASAVRLSIVDTLEGVGPSSVAALARIIGVAPDSLYYHLRILERRGLVKRVVDAAPRPQALVAVTAPSFELAYDARSDGNRAAIGRVAAAILRAAQRAFRAGFRGSVRTSGKRRELWIAQRTARLSPEQLEVVNALLNKLLDTFEHSPKASPGDRLYVLTFALSPYGKR